VYLDLGVVEIYIRIQLRRVGWNVEYLDFFTVLLQPSLKDFAMEVLAKCLTILFEQAVLLAFQSSFYKSLSFSG
jgi:hypothetical protein